MGRGVGRQGQWARYGDMPVSYIGREQCVANKRATGQTKDVADLEVLGEV